MAGEAVLWGFPEEGLRMHLPGGTESRGERTFPEKRLEEDPLLALTRLHVSSGPSPVWAGGAGQDGSREH